jgi:hypothetical protein
MSALHKIWDQAAAKQAGPACDEGSHSDRPLVSKFGMDRMAFSRMSSMTAQAGGAVRSFLTSQQVRARALRLTLSLEKWLAQLSTIKSDQICAKFFVSV